MSTELSNGVIIPEEYSDDWYDEMSINLRKLNDVITAASDNATDIQRLDTDKANQSDLTALSGRVTQNETDITALQTAVSDKANDSDVVHKSGDESIAGNKNFEGILSTQPISTLWTETNHTTDDITMLGNNAIHVEQKNSGKLTDLSGGAWTVAELGVGCFFFRINNGADIRYKNFAQNTVNRILVVSGANRFINNLTPDQDNTYNLGDSTRRWKSINGLNPSSLSLPDLNNGIDISSYITDLTGASNINKYTPSVNGWISIGLTGADFIELYIPSSFMGGTFTKSISNFSQAFMPVIANKEVRIALKGSSIGWAKFFPCQGNV